MSQRGHHTGHYGQGTIDIRAGGVMAQGEPDGSPRQWFRYPHGRQYVAGLEGPAGAGRSPGGADAPFAECDQELFALGHGRSKKAAEADAARRAWERRDA